MTINLKGRGHYESKIWQNFGRWVTRGGDIMTANLKGQ